MRKVLFDENMPRLLRLDLPEFEVRTVQEENWSGLKNGVLLRQAQGRFDVLVTADKRLEFQQNISQFNIAVVVADAQSTRLHHMQLLLPSLRTAIAQAKPGTVTVVSAG